MNVFDYPEECRNWMFKQLSLLEHLTFYSGVVVKFCMVYTSEIKSREFEMTENWQNI